MKTQVNVAKALAKQISLALQDSGHALPHSNALEIVAKALGARNWHAFLAENSAAAPISLGAVKQETTIPAWSPARGPMTDVQYARCQGLYCPVCGHGNQLTGDDIDVDGGTAKQEMGCGNCGASWDDHYELTGWGNLWQPEGKPLNIGFLYAIQLWLKGVPEAFDEDEQLLMDDLVLDACSRASLDRVNASEDAKTQVSSIENSESKASGINNQGLLGQLAYLLEGFDSPDAFIKFLADKFELSRDDLVL